jgi:hypothetical protein
MAAFYVAAYLSLSVPAVLAGFVATDVGIVQTFRGFSAVVMVIAFCVGLTASRLHCPTSAGAQELKARDQFPLRSQPAAYRRGATSKSNE